MYDTSEARGEDEDNDADDNDGADDDDDADDAVDKNVALMVVEVVVAAARCGRAQGKELGASCKAKLNNQRSSKHPGSKQSTAPT